MACCCSKVSYIYFTQLLCVCVCVYRHSGAAWPAAARRSLIYTLLNSYVCVCVCTVILVLHGLLLLEGLLCYFTQLLYASLEFYGSVVFLR
jgi:hypothetical protein